MPCKSPPDPLQRWEESPPEGEAASLSAIERALKSPSLVSVSDQGLETSDFEDTNAFRHHRPSSSRAPSTTSGESATSGSSQYSSQSSRSTFSKNNRNRNSSGVRKMQTDAKREKRSLANNPRIFCCTF
ncbi:hypothetical protein PENSTE_c046G00647 [Penicillium steckii]|uniref:Uncharacterized protein n=1 Tax=Penicillium steckii TaxID=303698 RepID=A0A1V6SJ70_9EURO|nr:hypothetical protein PENSTE_c046G00647 [Penicillium steckii]